MLPLEDKLKQAMVSLEELVHPEHTALLVIDMQNDGCHPEGWYAQKAGTDISMVRAIVPRISTLVEKARTFGVMVLWFRFTTLLGRLSDSPAYPIRRMTKQDAEKAIMEAGLKVEGTWGWQLIDELQPVPGEAVINKLRSSGFLATYTDILLRSNNIKTIIAVGNTTDGCVLTTAFDGLQSGYFTIVLEDCVADFSQKKHQVGIDFLKKRVDLVSSEAIHAAWSKA
jgi:nicotinamidase-related amidase